MLKLVFSLPKFETSSLLYSSKGPPGRDGVPGVNGVPGPPGHVFVIPVSKPSIFLTLLTNALRTVLSAEGEQSEFLYLMLSSKLLVCDVEEFVFFPLQFSQDGKQSNQAEHFRTLLDQHMVNCQSINCNYCCHTTCINSHVFYHIDNKD